MNFPVFYASALRTFCFGGLTIVVGLGRLQAAAPVLAIDHQPPRIEHITFEPEHPPSILQRSPGEEAAFCGTTFECVCGLYAETPKFTFGLGAAKITSVTVSTRAHIVVWTPEGGRPEYLMHEETHRAISEHYYREAGDVATRLAKKVLGKKIELPVRNAKQRLDETLTELRDQLIAAFMHEINDRTDFAQDRFDTISNHGREPIFNQAAMARAIEDEEAHWKSLQR